MLDISQILSQPEIIIFFIIFLAFIVIAYKIFQFVAKAFIVGIIAALFPIFANMFLGFNIPINIQSILWFALLGIEIFLVYSFLLSIGKIVKIITYPFRRKQKKK